MIDDASLETNVLGFRGKSFSFEKSLSEGGVEFLVFGRTEVESERQFRPRLVRLKVIIPRAQVLGDLASETLVLAPDGHTAGPMAAGTAQEVAADEQEFREQGVAFRRTVRSDGSIVYAPTTLPAGLIDRL